MKQNRAYPIEQYIDAGCAQFTSGSMGVATLLHEHSSGKLCEGCGIFFTPNQCPAYRYLTKAPAIAEKAPAVPEETVRAAAARLGVSISEIRRRRAAGALA